MKDIVVVFIVLTAGFVLFACSSRKMEVIRSNLPVLEE